MGSIMKEEPICLVFKVNYRQQRVKAAINSEKDNGEINWFRRGTKFEYLMMPGLKSQHHNILCFQYSNKKIQSSAVHFHVSFPRKWNQLPTGSQFLANQQTAVTCILFQPNFLQIRHTATTVNDQSLNPIQQMQLKRIWQKLGDIVHHKRSGPHSLCAAPSFSTSGGGFRAPWSHHASSLDLLKFR